MATMTFIERPMGARQRFARYVRDVRVVHRKDKLKTITQQRQENAVFYRVYCGKACVWPPFSL